jgi:hypothetical protein
MNVHIKKTRNRRPVELEIVGEDIVDYVTGNVTGYVSFENSFPKDLDFRFWDVKTHLRVHQSLFKYFSNKKKKAKAVRVIVKSQD